MPLFDYPSAEEILDDTGLRPEQVSPTYSSANLLVDIAEKITEAAEVVESRILAATDPEPWPFSEVSLAAALPRYSALQRAERAQRWAKLAQTATKWLAIAFLYERSGQLNKAYPDEASRYEAKVERLLTGSDDGKGQDGVLATLSNLAEAIKGGNLVGGATGAILTFIPAFDDAPAWGEFGGDFNARH